MKIPEKILIRLIFLMAVLFCLGLEIYSDYNSSICTVELSVEASVSDKGLNSNVDVFDDSNLNQFHEFSSGFEPGFRLPILNDFFVFQEYNVASWQPPRNPGIRI
jgi:hypothetical protein